MSEISTFDDRTNVLTNLRDAVNCVENETDIMGDAFWGG